MVRCGCTSGHQKEMCLKEVELRAQNTLTILGSTVNIIGGDLYDYFISTRIFTLIINKIIIRALSTRRKMATGMNWICYSSRTNCSFHIL